MTATVATNPPTNTEADHTVDAHEVGMMFVHEYYTILNKDPSRLHCFYNKQSTMSHGFQGEETQDIHSKIVELNFEDCKVLVSNVDSQSSLQGGIVIQVLGEMSNNGGVAQKFVQTFFLAVQPKGYYVLNDVFRYLRDENDVETEIFEDEAQETEPVYEIEAEVVEEVVEPTVVVEEDVNVAEKEETPVVEEPKVDVPEVVEEKKVVVHEEKKSEKKSDKKHDKKTDKKKDDNKESKKSKTDSFKKQSDVTESAEALAVAAVAAAPEVAAPPAPVEPPKPKTWASTAANNLNQWGSQVSAAKASTVTVNPPTPAKPHTAAAAAPVANRSASQRPSHTIDAHSIYVKNINERMSIDQLKEAFGKFGTVKNIELIARRTCAYVDFESVEAVQAALKQNVVQVGSETVLAEERRRQTGGFQSGGNRPFFGQNGGPRQGAPNGHHQGPQGFNNRGRPNPRGGFQDRKPLGHKPVEKAAPTVAVK
ncbi:hypothetical protein BGZ83_008914 [Gryganskiella cystojenkinii]|nr:hypothetical protein BGZ83_008914 [Gryganskiella cystojenkinii]